MNHPNPPTITPINPQSLTQTITPQQARHWLEHNNNHNRHLNPTTVKKYASDMREGNWQMNSMPIVFSDTGQLLDGQHRLAACVNVLPGMKSVYAWQGAVERADEVVAILKSREGLKDAIFAAVKGRHPYETPILLALPVQDADPDTAAWIMAETSGGA